MSALAWFGPVADFQIRRSVPAGYSLHVRGCVGNVTPEHPRCSDIAAGWKGPDGRRLPGMLARLRMPDERPMLAAFSAGGQCVSRLLLDARDRADVAGVYLADASYGEWASPGVVAIGEQQRALIAFALDCLADGRPFVVTASSHVPGGGGPSASQVLAAIRREVEAAAGHAFAPAEHHALFAGLRPMAWAVRCSAVFFVDFGSAYTHGEHATTIAPVLLPRVVTSPG